MTGSASRDWREMERRRDGEQTHTHGGGGGGGERASEGGGGAAAIATDRAPGGEGLIMKRHN